MIDLKEKTDDENRLEIPEIKENVSSESKEEQQIAIPKKKSKKWVIISIIIMAIILLIFSFLRVQNYI